MAFCEIVEFCDFAEPHKPLIIDFEYTKLLKSFQEKSKIEFRK